MARPTTQEKVVSKCPSSAAAKYIIVYGTRQENETFFLFATLMVALSGCEGDPGPTYEQVSANFDTFQKQSANAAERPYITSYHLGGDSLGNIDGEINNSWNTLSKTKRLALVKAIQQRWAAINSPEAISNSTMTLYYKGRDVAHVKYGTHSQWEIFAK